MGATVCMCASSPKIPAWEPDCQSHGIWSRVWESCWGGKGEALWIELVLWWWEHSKKVRSETEQTSWACIICGLPNCEKQLGVSVILAQEHRALGIFKNVDLVLQVQRKSLSWPGFLLRVLLQDPGCLSSCGWEDPWPSVGVLQAGEGYETLCSMFCFSFS